VIIFTNHSLLKLKQRKIPRKFVIETIKSPDHVGESYSDRKTCFKKFSKLYLKVIYKNEVNNVVVITQHWVKEID
jgi:hypothetical protein